jgi:hypothetical protein
LEMPRFQAWWRTHGKRLSDEFSNLLRFRSHNAKTDL